MPRIYFAPKTADQATQAPLAGTHGALALSEDTGNFWRFLGLQGRWRRRTALAARVLRATVVKELRDQDQPGGQLQPLVMSPQARRPLSSAARLEEV